LYAESNQTDSNKDPILSDKQKQQSSGDSQDLVDDALSTSSVLSFNGNDVDVKNSGNGASSEENKALTKAATH